MSSLTQQDIQVLHEALDDEYRSWSTYGQVISDFGDIRPFVNIQEAEGRHIEALLSLYERFDVSPPENPWPNKVDRYENLHQASEAAVAGEIENAQMYERLLKTTENPDIIRVLGRLQEASQERHLPAFRRFANLEAERAKIAEAVDHGCCGGCGGTGHD